MSKKKISVKLIGSPAGCSDRQKRTVKGLGFTKLNQVKEIDDTPSLRGMVQKIPHLVVIVNGESL